MSKLSDPKAILVARVLHEKKHVTYRLLSRLAKIHVAHAKQALFAFHADYPAPKTRATLIVCGIPKAASSRPVNGGAHSQEMQIDEEEKPREQIPQLKIVLVNHDDLEATKKDFEQIHSIHVYSVGPKFPEDASVLTGVNEELDTDKDLKKVWKDSENGKTFGLIQIPSRKAAAPKKPVKEDPKPEASTSKSKPATESRPLKRKSSLAETATAKDDAPVPSSSKGKSKVTSAKTTDMEVDKAEAAKREQLERDMEAMADMDWDEAADLSFEVNAKARDKEQTPSQTDKFKGKDKSTLFSQTKEDSIMAGPSSSNAAPDQSQPKGEKKRVRKTRIVKKTTFVDGYKKREDVEESYSESEAEEEPAKSQAPKSSATEKKDGKKAVPVKKAASKPTGRPGEQTTMASFFKRK